MRGRSAPRLAVVRGDVVLQVRRLQIPCGNCFAGVGLAGGAAESFHNECFIVVVRTGVFRFTCAD